MRRATGILAEPAVAMGRPSPEARCGAPLVCAFLAIGMFRPAAAQTFYDLTGAGRGTPQLQMTMAQCDLIAQQQVAPLLGQNYGRGLGGAIGTYAVISQAKANAYMQCILANGWSRQRPPNPSIESQQSEPKSVAQISDSLNKNLPRRLDNYTVLNSISVIDNNEIAYNYEISDINGIALDQPSDRLALMIDSMKADLINKWCASSTSMWKQGRYFIHYVYRAPDKAIIYQFVLDSSVCGH